jgi:3-hydroxybutyryl-CoA dehydratase
MTRDVPGAISDVKQGQVAERQMLFTEEAVATFAGLVDDHAPVHFDKEFAVAQGFEGCIAHGFLTSAAFSGLLGEQLPGPKSIINSVNLKMHKPISIGDMVTYRVTIDQVSEAVGAVVLSLSAVKQTGEQAVTGKAMCSFPGL